METLEDSEVFRVNTPLIVIYFKLLVDTCRSHSDFNDLVRQKYFSVMISHRLIL